MTKKTRYFLFGAVGALVVGLGGGLIAYLAYNRVAGVPEGLPAEVRYVPANAEVVAYANIQAVMNSDLRRELLPTIEGGSHKGRQMMNDFGVDLEKQVHHIVAYVEPVLAARSAGTGAIPVSERLSACSGLLRPGAHRAAHP